MRNYEEQGRAGKRKIDHKSYIAAQWLLDRLGGVFEKCGAEVYVSSKKR